MAITRVSLSSLKTPFKSDSFLAGNAAYSPSAFESIATVTASGSASSITISNIPSTYASLQLRINYKFSTAASSVWLSAINGSGFGGVGAWHVLYGDGATAGAAGATGQNQLFIASYNGSGTTYNGVAIVDFHNYANTSQNKTIRSFSGYDANGSGEVDLLSCLWQNTAAISSLTITGGNNFAAGSTFALYGIKGA